MKTILRYFTPLEWCLWLGGMAAVSIGFFAGIAAEAQTTMLSVLSLLSSLFGITCVIFNAKGSVWGQAFSIIFALLYAALAYFNRYFGEMIIYLALMLPIHIASIVGWIRNRNEKAAHMEVNINRLTVKEYILFAFGTAAVTCAFYFLLQALNTDNLIVSTVSLVTSLGAAYLMLRRCEYFALFFIANDVILIVLWSLKIAADGMAVVPSIVSFSLFLLNDAYSFFSWKKIKRRQRASVIDEP